MSENHSSIRNQFGDIVSNTEADIRRVLEGKELDPIVIRYADQVAEEITRNLTDLLKKGITIGEVSVKHIGIDKKVLTLYNALADFSNAHRNGDPQDDRRIRNLLAENGLVDDLEPREIIYVGGLSGASSRWCISLAKDSRWKRLFVDRLTENCRKEEIELEFRLEDLIVEYRANRTLIDFVRSKGIRIEIYPHLAAQMARKCLLAAKDAELREDYERAANMYRRAQNNFSRAGTGYASDRIRSKSKIDINLSKLAEKEYEERVTENYHSLVWHNEKKWPQLEVAEKGFDQWAVDETYFMIRRTIRLAEDRRQAFGVAMRFTYTQFPVVDYGYNMDGVQKYLEDVRQEILFKAERETNKKGFLPCFAPESVLAGEPQEKYSVCAICGSRNLRNHILGRKCGSCGNIFIDYP